jgi:hypothetical protein
LLEFRGEIEAVHIRQDRINHSGMWFKFLDGAEPFFSGVCSTRLVTGASQSAYHEVGEGAVIIHHQDTDTSTNLSWPGHRGNYGTPNIASTVTGEISRSAPNRALIRVLVPGCVERCLYAAKVTATKVNFRCGRPLFRLGKDRQPTRSTGDIFGVLSGCTWQKC